MAVQEFEILLDEICSFYAISMILKLFRGQNSGYLMKLSTIQFLRQMAGIIVIFLFLKIMQYHCLIHWHSCSFPDTVCTDTIALMNSGPAVITCYLNDKATFTVINVTYWKLGATDVQQLASIDDSHSITMFAMEEIVSISMSNNIINLTILNPSCTNEGTFAVVTDINGLTIKGQGKLSVISMSSLNRICFKT